IKAFDRAANDPAVKVPALFGRGNAKLELADLDGARADFAAVLEQAKDHIGAQIGLAAAQPPSAAQQQEDDLLAILARKDIAQADPRAVAQAWTLAGTAAMRAGRLDVARERLRKALAAIPQDVAATTRLAETELRDGKLATAADLTATALTLAKDNVPAQLVQSEIEIKQNKLPLAADRLAALANHVTPLAPLDRARLFLVTGKLLEAQGKDAEAVDAYTQGAKAAGDLDLAPMMAAVGKLAQLTAAATQAKNAARADELRARADELLGELASHAEREPHLAMTLGVAYLQQGNAAKAEPWLRRVVEARPNDAEARFQLGRARLSTGHPEDALEALNAALALDASRADIGAELARTYEALGRDTDASAMYTRLLVAKDPSLELRARAGRFYARTGAIDKAGEQGAKIVEADPHSAAGLYLKGEGLLAAGKALDARQMFQHALEVDRDPQYLDALGRAAEALAKGGDRELQDLALRSYQAAAEAAPAMSNPLAGQGRLYVARHEAAKAVRPLLDAARIEPRNADVQFLLGAAYQELQLN
ncbi:MAG: tetratricopeptide repeat protein, partial [bacterium]